MQPRDRLRERSDVTGRHETVLADQLGERADAARGDGQAGGHRLGSGESEGLGGARRHERDRGACAQALQLGIVDAPGEANARTGDAVTTGGTCFELCSLGTVAGDDEREPGGMAGVDRDIDPLLGRQAGDDERVGGQGRPLRARGQRQDTVERGQWWREHVHALRGQGRAELAQPLAREDARHDDRIGLREETSLPERERGGIGGGLGGVSTAVQAHAGERVASVAARALGAAREADADRADKAVLVQVQHDAGAGGAGGGERAPAERGLEVVGVHDASAARAHGCGDFAWVEPALQQPARSAATGDLGGGSREQLGGLVQALAHEPDEILDGALLATGRAIAIVQEQDHRWSLVASGRASPERAERPKPAANLDCPTMTSASIVIPTRARLPYLEVALASIAPQARAAGAELLVVDDAGASARARALAERFGARYEPHDGPLGLNVARNTGVERSTGQLVVFVDDDIRADAGWLAALLAAAREHPEVDVFAGPIRPRLEDHRLHSCGREHPPITSLELGEHDSDARYAWGANMAIRRSALERVGRFDESLEHGGDEQEWQDRFRAASGGGSGRVLYVAGAPVEHRRAGADARLGALARAQHVRGRAARRFDARQGQAPSLARELLTLAACAGHVVRRRCPAGSTMVAHSAGRLREAVRERGRDGAVSPMPRAAAAALGGDPDDFLSGTSGTVGGFDAILRDLRDRAEDGWELASGQRLRIARAARREPPRRRVLVLGIERPAHRLLAERAQAELQRSRHDVELRIGAPGELGKFENLNRLLGAGGAEDYDWLLVLDDDVELPRGFLDRFVFLCERFSLQLAQPAHRLASHAAWPQTRRHASSVVRETAFVEIGPVTAFARATFATLLPFPQLRMGWGLDAHWGALARAQGWRCGVADAVAIGHRAAPAADAYSRDAAIAEARAFLAARPYVRAQEAKRTLMTHRSW
jgi:GT2 family glycosyltransferase